MLEAHPRDPQVRQARQQNGVGPQFYHLSSPWLVLLMTLPLLIFILSLVSDSTRITGNIAQGLHNPRGFAVGGLVSAVVRTGSVLCILLLAPGQGLVLLEIIRVRPRLQPLLLHVVRRRMDRGVPDGDGEAKLGQDQAHPGRPNPHKPSFLQINTYSVFV